VLFVVSHLKFAASFCFTYCSFYRSCDIIGINNNFTGSDSFTYKINDGKIYSAIATVSITVTGGGGTDFFSASINVPGYSLAFNPTQLKTDFVYWQPNWTDPVVTLLRITASEGTADVDETVSLSLDPRQISGPGTYSVGYYYDEMVDGLFQASLSYRTPDILTAGGTPLGFGTDSGTLSLTSYGETAGDRIAGTFSATISYWGDGPTIAGTISGSFDVPWPSQ